MTHARFLSEFEQIVEAPAGTIKGTEDLASLSGWESMAKIAFLALVHQHCGIVLSVPDVLKCKTVGDLMALTGVRSSPQPSLANV